MIFVVLDTSDDQMVGSDGWRENEDAEESVFAYITMVQQALASRFNCPILVVGQPQGLVADTIEVNAPNIRIEDVQFAIAEVFLSYRWKVRRAP